jgi:hypothetical protein
MQRLSHLISLFPAEEKKQTSLEQSAGFTLLSYPFLSFPSQLPSPNIVQIEEVTYFFVFRILTPTKLFFSSKIQVLSFYLCFRSGFSESGSGS